jgi:Peptidase family U32/Peptidase family U32 C-terminal domain
VDTPGVKLKPPEYKTHDASDQNDAGEVQPVKMDGDFNFAQAQAEAEGAFAACGGSPRHPLADQVWLLEEKERPGELMPLMEDEHGTYILNSKDLRAVEHVERLVRIGVDSLKIEGRTKSQYYVSRTAQVYRRAIGDAVAGRAFDPSLLLALEGLSNRGYTAGFLERRPSQDYQNYLSGSSQTQRSQFVGEVKSVRTQDGWAEVETKNRFAVGDTLEVIHPSGNRLVKLDQMTHLDGEPVQVASGSPLRVWVRRSRALCSHGSSSCRAGRLRDQTAEAAGAGGVGVIGVVGVVATTSGASTSAFRSASSSVRAAFSSARASSNAFCAAASCAGVVAVLALAALSAAAAASTPSCSALSAVRSSWMPGSAAILERRASKSARNLVRAAATASRSACSTVASALAVLSARNLAIAVSSVVLSVLTVGLVASRARRPWWSPS